MNREYLDWLRQLPINRGAQRRSWVGVVETEQAYIPYEMWQQRAIERDAPRGVIARWMRWLNS